MESPLILDHIQLVRNKVELVGRFNYLRSDIVTDGNTEPEVQE